MNFQSKHSDNLPMILNLMRISLLVTTYQAGQAILIRKQGQRIDTNFTSFKRPMGVAYDGKRLAIASQGRTTEYYDQPEAGGKIDDEHTYDGCFVPRNIHFTGAVDPHEMAYGEQGLYLINTMMSCLCLVTNESSFKPIWKPHFITGYDLTDRCHLNGLAMRDGRPAYVTALGESDTGRGWHKDRTTSGILMDVERNEIVADDLSMPHSPRWENGALYYLESGKGTLNKYYPGNGKHVVLGEFGSFTRGLTVIGQFAFIGLSKAREPKMFSGTEVFELKDDKCAVVIYDMNTQRIVATIEFQGDVEEIFAVQPIPRVHPAILGETEELTECTFAVPNRIHEQIKKTGL